MARKSLKDYLQLAFNPLVLLLSIFAGAATGYYAPHFAKNISFFGNIFLDLLQMCCIPLVVTALITSISKILHKGDVRKYIIPLISISAISLILASSLGMATGSFAHIKHRSRQETQVAVGRLLNNHDYPIVTSTKTNNSSQQEALKFIPKNIFSALVNERFTAIIVFSILFGITLGFVNNETGVTTLTVLEGIYTTFLKLISGILYLLPLGLFCLFATQVALTGFAIMYTLGRLILLTYIALITLFFLHILITSIRFRQPIWHMLYKLRTPLFIAFATTSSFATIPVLLQTFTSKFKLNQDKISLFVPLGVCINPQGSTCFYSLLSMYMMNLYGHPFSLHAMIIILFANIILAISIGGVPAIVGFTALQIVFNPLNLPMSVAVILFLSVAQLVDPIITLANVSGNCMLVSLLSGKPKDNQDIDLNIQDDRTTQYADS